MSEISNSAVVLAQRIPVQVERVPARLRLRPATLNRLDASSYLACRRQPNSNVLLVLHVDRQYGTVGYQLLLNTFKQLKQELETFLQVTTKRNLASLYSTCSIIFASRDTSVKTYLGYL